ncbi:FHA domain-containing protein [Bdellovibrio sp. NC01]|uniref:FHA domain-containing protein n=1 Tax=Bdellovibrio sp. NC01 TaxID=2220073 RepID=UPI00115B147D|nr:FHA domain-containing protein [Bdellovibrio sp. NC01]QDK37077.1 hypothetical protein DOE51_05455 [Bdellovibrio sp. NC01]
MNTFTITIHRKDQILTKVVNKDSFTVGRSLDCDISLNESLISRVHLVVSRRWNQIWIEDKNSSNGTFLNGTKIVQGTPVNVINSDRIQLGKSEYILFIDLQTEEVQPEPELPELPPEREPPVEASATPSGFEETVAMPPPAMAPFQAEKILHEAKRKAAQIILEGETQAEKRVQVIYQKARDAQAQSDIYYQTRMAEAHKEADAILTDFQQQGRALLAEARTMAQELREEVDVYVQNLKQKAKADVENLTAEATLQAEKLKVEAFEAARASGQVEAEALVKKAQENADRSVEFAKLQVNEIQDKVKSDKELLQTLEQSLRETNQELESAREAFATVKASQEETSKTLTEQSEALTDLTARYEELKTVHAQLEVEHARIQQDHAETQERIQREHDELQSRVLAEHEENQARIKAEHEAAVALMQTEHSALQEKNSSEHQANQDRIQAEHAKTMEALKAEHKAALEKQQQQQAHLAMDIHDLEAKKAHLFKEYDGQKIFLNEKLEKEKSQIMKSEEVRLEEMRIEMSKRLHKMEQDLLDDLICKKATMVKEIHSLVEREIVQVMDTKQWSTISEQVEHKIQEAIDGRVATLSQSSVNNTAKPVDLMKKRKAEKMRWATAGLAMGALVYFVSQVAVERVSSDKAPLRTIAAAEAKKRQDDLEKRKFNPPQAEELKDSYTDSVIYTRNYPEIYLDNEFQQKLYKATANYLLKTWRIDEDRSLQVLSASNALVKELLDRKSKIHPDFIKEGLDKMHIFENQTLARMKDLLGSEVRLESYRRFERNFYKEEVQRRRMAQH